MNIVPTKCTAVEKDGMKLVLILANNNNKPINCLILNYS